MIDDFQKFQILCSDSGYLNPKQLVDGRFAAIMPLIFTGAIITLGAKTYMSCYDDRWCYHSKVDAAKALDAWDGTGEPTGWHRHPLSGRRRDDGDPLKEYINP